MRRAIVLFSGGVDSTTTLAIAVEEGYNPVAVTFDYGQRHHVEIERSRQVLKQFSSPEQILLKVDLTQIGGSALTSPIAVPKSRRIDPSIPVTYVPGRNLIFLSMAAAVGEVLNIYDLFFGANVLDYSGYPDCRPEFLTSLEQTLNLGTKAGAEGKSFRIHAPLLSLTKREIILKGMSLGVDYQFTHSCYDPGPEGEACGVCDSCQLRLKGFQEAGLSDPVKYAGTHHE
jgi:7-cyano-7-deazaguanine synthase